MTSSSKRSKTIDLAPQPKGWRRKTSILQTLDMSISKKMGHYMLGGNERIRSHPKLQRCMFCKKIVCPKKNVGAMASYFFAKNKFRWVSNLLCFKGSKVKYTTSIATGACHTSDVHPMRNPIERLSKPLLYSNIRGWLVSWSPIDNTYAWQDLSISYARFMTHDLSECSKVFRCSGFFDHVSSQRNNGSFPPSFAQLPAIRKEDAILCLLWNTQQRQFPELP